MIWVPIQLTAELELDTELFSLSYSISDFRVDNLGFNNSIYIYNSVIKNSI